MGERISGSEDKIEKIDSSVKENVKQKHKTKYPGDMGHHEKAKPENNRDRRKRSPTQRHEKYIQQNHRRKLSQPKEGYPYKGTRKSLQNTK